MTHISKRVLGTKWVLRAGDGRFKARLVTTGRMQRHGTDRSIVAAKDKSSMAVGEIAL